MSNRPHARNKKVSNVSINVQKKPVNTKEKKPSIIKSLIGTLIKK